VIVINRIEIIGLFTAIKELCEAKEFDRIKTIVDAVLEEARYKTKPKSQTEIDDD